MLHPIPHKKKKKESNNNNNKKYQLKKEGKKKSGNNYEKKQKQNNNIPNGKCSDDTHFIASKHSFFFSFSFEHRNRPRSVKLFWSCQTKSGPPSCSIATNSHPKNPSTTSDVNWFSLPVTHIQSIQARTSTDVKCFGLAARH